MTSGRESLDRELDALGISPTETVRQKLVDYLGLLDHWNRTINLTSLASASRVRRLVAEPLWVAQQLAPTGHYLDIGSGNGSPSIPWLAACAFESAALVESRDRRAVFLGVVARRLGIAGVAVHAARFEALEGALAPADWVTLQGVRLDTQLLTRIRSLNPGASVVWLTRRPVLPEVPLRRLEIPDSDRQAVVFGPVADPS